MIERELKFLATPEKGDVSGLLVRPEGASHLLVLGHGASTNMRHATLRAIAEALADAGIATLRYNFPYAEHGTGRDSQAVCTQTIRAAVALAREVAPGLPILAGGHSFGGRMTSTAASESPLDGVHGLVFFSFPLHQPGKPETKRPKGFFPRIDAITVYAIAIERVTGKETSLPPLSEQWPAKDRSKTPNASPPAQDA